MDRELQRQIALQRKQLGRLLSDPSFNEAWSAVLASVSVDFKVADTDDKRRDVWAMANALDRLKSALDGLAFNGDFEWEALKDQ